MLLFGHIGVTLGVFIGLGILDPQLKNIIDPKYLVIGALLPDLIDKPLGMVIFSSILASGRIIGHTLLLSISILLIGLYLYDKRRDIRIISLALGSFFHLMEDQIWGEPRTLLWPLFGWSFPKDSIDNTGLEHLLVLFNQSFHPQFSESYIPEILGIGVVAILTIYWLKNKLDKTNSKDKKVNDEDNEKPDSETAALYSIGFILFGYLVVKAITTL
jgi:hypothetical protein